MARSRTYKGYVTSRQVIVPRRTKHRLVKTLRVKSNQLSNKMISNEGFEKSEMSHAQDDFCSVEDGRQSKVQFDPMYGNAKISEIESTILLFGFTTRHRLTKEAAEDLLTLVNNHLPVGISVPSSTYLLRKNFSSDESTKIVTTHYVCEECESYVGNEVNALCAECGSRVTTENVFLTFDLGILLSEALKDKRLSTNLYKNLEKRNDNSGPSSGFCCDITDGFMYKQMNQKRYDITCLLNTDGIPAFKSSNKSLWPILVSINELDYKLRRNNTFIAGLWIGNSKPDFDVFLDPVVRICNGLQRKPIRWNCNGKSMGSFIRFPIFTADSVARCQVQGTNQFNGAYGCPWCLQKGQTVWISEKSHKWIYPFQKGSMALRTHHNFLDHVTKLKSEMDDGNLNCKHVFGVNSASQLLLLGNFDMANGFVFDVMHTAFLGVTRTFTNTWMDSSNRDKPYYIGTKRNEIDKRLRMFSVPFESSRAIRPITDSSHWKASECGVWTYILPMVLKGILSDAYLGHFQKYATAMMVLNDSVIKDGDRVFASTQLKRFVDQIDVFYGIKSYTFNGHALLHGAECVKNWGPLWAYSAFQFEHFNGILLNNFKGSQYVVKQIASRTVETIQLLKLGREAIANEHLKYFYDALIEGGRYYQKYQRADNGVMFVGPSKNYKFSDRELKGLETLGVSNLFGVSFRRCIVLGKMFTTKETDSKKRCNSIVFTSENDLILIKKLIYVPEVNKGFTIGNSIRHNLDSANPYLVNVKGICKTLNVLNITNLTQQKYIVRKSIGISSLVRLPNV